MDIEPTKLGPEAEAVLRDLLSQIQGSAAPAPQPAPPPMPPPVRGPEPGGMGGMREGPPRNPDLGMKPTPTSPMGPGTPARPRPDQDALLEAFLSVVSQLGDTSGTRAALEGKK